jgi:hypothetical protein
MDPHDFPANHEVEAPADVAEKSWGSIRSRVG